MNDTTTPSFSGGELLAGKYRVERIIGEGGMGIVLAAEHEALRQKVAIKLLRSNALEHTDVLGRFLREGRAAVSLRSEHVARVLDVGNLEDGRPFIVMERLEGQDLGDVIDRGQTIPIPVVVDYVMQACEAVAEAHAAGIIHRDLKPKNLFLTHAVHGRPLVKVLDFGISKIDPGRAQEELQLTRTTEVIGSPSYMSPEQLRSARNVDTRTDIWALGVILYELLTGRLPFYAETVTELVLVVVTEQEPPIRSLRGEVPDALAMIVHRCLMKRPEDRFQSVVELVQALEPYADGVQATATDRVRAVAGIPHTTPLSAPRLSGQTPALSGSGSYPGTPLVPPNASSSSRVNVHGGTSVAWGETQSQVGPSPSLQPYIKPNSGLLAGLAAMAVAFVVIGAGGTMWYLKRGTPPPPAVAVGDKGLPLPPGRKDLPPLSSSSTIALPSTPDPPPASALPETRNPILAATTVAKAAPPKANAATGVAAHPAKQPDKPDKPPDKPDDLNNIGRR